MVASNLPAVQAVQEDDVVMVPSVAMLNVLAPLAQPSGALGLSEREKYSFEPKMVSTSSSEYELPSYILLPQK